MTDRFQTDLQVMADGGDLDPDRFREILLVAAESLEDHRLEDCEDAVLEALSVVRDARQRRVPAEGGDD